MNKTSFSSLLLALIFAVGFLASCSDMNQAGERDTFATDAQDQLEGLDSSELTFDENELDDEETIVEEAGSQEDLFASLYTSEIENIKKGATNIASASPVALPERIEERWQLESVVPLLEVKGSQWQINTNNWNGLTQALKGKVFVDRNGTERTFSPERFRFSVGYRGHADNYRTNGTKWDGQTIKKEYEVRNDPTSAVTRYPNWARVTAQELIDLVNKYGAETISSVDDLNGREFIIRLSFFEETEEGKFKGIGGGNFVQQVIRFNQDGTPFPVTIGRTEEFVSYFDQSPQFVGATVPQSVGAANVSFAGGLISKSTAEGQGGSNAVSQKQNVGFAGEEFRNVVIDLRPIRENILEKQLIKNVTINPRRYFMHVNHNITINGVTHTGRAQIDKRDGTGNGRVRINRKALQQAVAWARNKAAGQAEKRDEGWKFVNLDGLSFEVRLNYGSYADEYYPVLSTQDEFTVTDNSGGPIILQTASEQGLIGLTLNNAKQRRWEIDGVPSNVSVGQESFENRYFWYGSTSLKGGATPWLNRQYIDVENVKRADGSNYNPIDVNGIFTSQNVLAVTASGGTPFVKVNNGPAVNDQWISGDEILWLELGSLPNAFRQRIMGAKIVARSNNQQPFILRLHLHRGNNEVGTAISGVLNSGEAFELGNLGNLTKIGIQAVSGQVQLASGSEFYLNGLFSEALGQSAFLQNAGNDKIALVNNASNENNGNVRWKQANTAKRMPAAVEENNAPFKNRYFWYGDQNDFRNRQYIVGIPDRTNTDANDKPIVVEDLRGVFGNFLNYEGTAKIGRNNVLRLTGIGGEVDFDGFIGVNTPGEAWQNVDTISENEGLSIKLGRNPLKDGQRITSIKLAVRAEADTKVRISIISNGVVIANKISSTIPAKTNGVVEFGVGLPNITEIIVEADSGEFGIIQGTELVLSKSLNLVDTL
jgi:hypothetical protein